MCVSNHHTCVHVQADAMHEDAAHVGSNSAHSNNCKRALGSLTREIANTASESACASIAMKRRGMSTPLPLRMALR